MNEAALPERAGRRDRLTSDADETIGIRTGFAVFAANGRLVVHSPDFTEFLGVSGVALRPGLAFDDLVAQLRDRLDAADAGGGAFLAAQAELDRGRSSAMRRVRPDGTIVEVASAPLPDGGWTITASDITPVLRARDEARRRMTMLDNVLENVPHGVCVYGPDRRVSMFNPAYVEIMRGAPLAIGDHIETVIRRRAEVGEYGSGTAEVVFRQEMGRDIGRPQLRRRRRPNGTTIDVRTAPLPDGGHISVVTDVTPLTQAEAELLRNAADMDGMLANIQHGIMLFDAERRLIAANPVASELLGLPADLLVPGRSDMAIGQAMFERGALGEGPDAASTLVDRLSGDASISYMAQRRTAAGRVIEVRSDPAPGGRLVLTYTDVTAAEEIRAELQRAKLAAEAANHAKSRFLATMSHELRTPLNAVMGFSEALIRDAADRDPARMGEYAAAINEAGGQLLSLINTILDVARIEAGRIEMSADLIDLERLVRGAVGQAQSGFQAGEISVSVVLPEDLPQLRADERRLRQVLANLFSNAAKFTPAGGAVAVQAAVEEDGRLLLAVSDSGIGIPSSELERVFEPFTQVDAGFARRFQGAGLGLYISRSLIRAHGGSLQLRSVEGSGTTAEIRLPEWRLAWAGPHHLDKDVA